MPARCPVCGDELRGAHVSCIRCETPHHEDCFTTGHQNQFGCGIYACGGTQYRSLGPTTYPVNQLNTEQSLLTPEKLTRPVVIRETTQPTFSDPMSREALTYFAAETQKYYVAGSFNPDIFDRVDDLQNLIAEKLGQYPFESNHELFFLEVIEGLEKFYDVERTQRLRAYGFGALCATSTFLAGLTLVGVLPSLCLAGGGYSFGKHVWGSTKQHSEMIERKIARATLESFIEESIELCSNPNMLPKRPKP